MAKYLKVFIFIGAVALGYFLPSFTSRADQSSVGTPTNNTAKSNETASTNSVQRKTSASEPNLDELRSINKVSLKCRSSGPEVFGNLPCDDLSPKYDEAFTSPTARYKGKKVFQNANFCQMISRAASSGSGSTDQEATDFISEQSGFNSILQCEEKEYNTDSNKKRPGTKSVVKCMVRKNLAFESGSYYCGQAVDWFTGEHYSKAESTPVCNITQGEVDNNWLPDGQNSCQGFCNVSIGSSVSLNGGCQKENAWFRGAYIQALNYYKEQIFAELDSNEVKVTNYDGPKPCARIAHDLIRHQQRANDLLDRMIDFGAKGREVASSATRAQKEEAVSQIQCIPGQEDQASVSPDKRIVTSVATCHMHQAQRDLRMLWSSFLSCEIHARADKDFVENSQKVAQNIKVFNEVVDKCKAEVMSCLPFCTKSKMESKANSCYKRELPGAVQKALDSYKTKQPPELPDEATKKKTAANSNSNFLALGLLSSLKGLRRKKHKKTNKKANHVSAVFSTIAFVVAALTLVLFQAGCSCGGKGKSGGYLITPPAPQTPPEDVANNISARLDDELPAVEDYLDGSNIKATGVEESKAGGTPTSQAATAGLKETNPSSKPSNVSPSETPKSIASGLSLPGVVPSVQTSGDDNRPAVKIGSVEVPPLVASDNENSADADANARTLYSSSREFQNASAAHGGNNAKSNGPDLKNLFKGNGSGAVGGRANNGGAESLALGSKTESNRAIASDVENAGARSTDDFDNYLNRMGNVSLFDVVTKRYVRWNDEIEANKIKY